MSLITSLSLITPNDSNHEVAPCKDCNEVDGDVQILADEGDVLADEGGVLAIADTTDLDLETEGKLLHIVAS